MEAIIPTKTPNWAVLTLLYWYSLPAHSTQCQIPENIVIEPHNIFSDQDAELYWYKRLANKLHIVSKQHLIKEESNGFTPCLDDPRSLYEIERYLRNLRYVRDAKVTRKNQDVIIKTYDTWSLLPTLNYSREGGESKSAIGLKDSNFLGYGINTKLKFTSDSQRKGYQVSLGAPLYTGNNLYGQITMANNDDGQLRALSLAQPFISLSRMRGSSLEYRRFQRNVPIKAFGQEVAKFSQDSLSMNTWYGARIHRSNNWASRLLIGLEVDKQTFSQYDFSAAPNDRDLVAPWLGFHYKQDKYRKKNNIYLIDRVEDINFGFNVQVQAGFNVESSTISKQGATWSMALSKAFDLSERAFFKTMFQHSSYPKVNSGRYLDAKFDNEFFYKLMKKVQFYLSMSGRASQNQYLDQPVSLGGLNGMRGFGNQFEHGSHYLKATAETRLYPNWNILGLINVGAVGFYDIGKTFGASNYKTPQKLMQSVGIGARLYPIHSSNNNIIHVDYSKPIYDGKNYGDWELRIKVLTHF